ncbi:MAG: 16S rRNA (guanine(527)-N(7))-methyltransferase RsmG [Pseudomonadota bacterium]
MQREQEILESGAQQLGCPLSADQTQKLLEYLALMQKWNKTYNLTAIRTGPEMVVQHLLDSLAVLPYLWQGKWLDVGCGGGLPGVVLAIMRPDWQFTLLDSNSKKTGFVQQVAIQLGLQNLKVHTGRVEEYAVEPGFDGIISRAFTELKNFFQLTGHLLAQGGRWAAMKGKLEEPLPQGYCIEDVVTLDVPMLDATRTLVIASKEREKTI